MNNVYSIRLLITANDFVSRYCGEEFAVILTEKSKSESFQLVDTIRANISQMIHSEMNHKPVTVSIGMCSYEVGLGKEPFSKLLIKPKRTARTRLL